MTHSDRLSDEQVAVYARQDANDSNYVPGLKAARRALLADRATWVAEVERLRKGLEELQQQRDAWRVNAMHDLAVAMRKVMPELAQQVAERWETIKAENEAALNRFIAVLNAADKRSSEGAADAH